MYLGPLSMDYTGAVAKETRYIVSLDRLVKKQHIWGFHQDNFVFRKLEPPDLLQSCPSCGAGPIKWSAIRNKRHNSRVSRLRCNRQAKGTCDYRGALRRTERKRMLRNPAASDSPISSQPVEEAFTMLSEAMQLLQMADKPTLRSYISDSLPKPIRRFIHQFLVLEDPKDLVFHRMSATNNSHIHDPNKHSFVRGFLTPDEGIRSDNLPFDQRGPPVPILPATHERPSLEQHLQHLRREEQQYLQPRRSLPGDSRLAPHLQSNQPLRRESHQQLRRDHRLQPHQLLRREPRLQSRQLLPGDSRQQPLLQETRQKLLQPESQQQQLRREAHLRSQPPADSRQKPQQVISQDSQQDPRHQLRREADIQSNQRQLSQQSNQQQTNESNQQPNLQPKPQLQQQLRQVPKQEPPQQPRRQPRETQPHSSWTSSAVSTRAVPAPMRPRGGMFFPPRGNTRFGSGMALNGRRPKAIPNMNPSMTMGMIPRLQQIPPKIARGMVPSLVPAMVPRMVPRAVPRNAADNGPTMRSNINHRAAPWHPRAPVNGDRPQNATSMPSHSDPSSKFKAPPPPPPPNPSSSPLPSKKTTPQEKASALDQLAFEASRSTTATSRPNNKRNLGELKEVDKTGKTDVDLEPPRSLTKTEKEASAAVRTSTSETATQNTTTKVTEVKQLEQSDKKNPAGAVMCPCCFKMIVPTDKRFCMSCGTNLKPTTITI